MARITSSSVLFSLLVAMWCVGYLGLSWNRTGRFTGNTQVMQIMQVYVGFGQGFLDPRGSGGMSFVVGMFFVD